MSFELKEKLIELVIKHECIYNPAHKQYKNISYKTKLWDNIAAELNIEGSKAKETWRCLRDGYIRYKKQLKGQSGAGRKYCYFTWSSQLAFLDKALKLRSTTLQNGSKLPQSPTTLFGDPTGPQQSSLTLELPHSLEPSLSSPQSGCSWVRPPPPSHTPDFNTSTQSVPPDTNSPSMVFPLLLQKILEAENKRRAEYDAVDLLFMSYAATFRRLSLRKQAELKVNLAKLFANAELGEMDNFPLHCSQPCSPIIHSVMSEETTPQNILIAEDLKVECDSE